MEVSAVWALPVCACALVAYLLMPSAGQRAVRSLPTPESTLPFLGNTLDLMTYQLPRLHDWITEQCLRFEGRPWLLQALGAPPLVVVSSVEGFEDVVKTQFEIFDKGKRMREIFEDMVGDGIIAVDGDKWKFQRKKLSHLFTMRAFRETITTSIHKYILVLGDLLEKAAKDPQQTPFDYGDACQRMAFDIFAEVGFGLQKNTLATGKDTSFIEALIVAGKVIEHRFHQPDFVWKLKRLLRIGDERLLIDAVEGLNREVYAIIYENLRRKNDPNYKQKQPALKDVLSLFIDEIEEEKATTSEKKTDNPAQKVDIKYLRDVGLTILSAGKETTALTFMWFIITLNRNPGTSKKIRDELRAKLPQLFTDRSYVPSMEDIEQLVYLEATLRETLRLHPIVPLNAKEANRDTTLSDGTFIAKGTRVYIPSYALGRMPSIWGPDAAEYKPERWIEVDELTGKQKLIVVPATKFVGFHAGPRICLGMRFALFELKSGLAYMLSKYELTTVKKPEEFTYVMSPALAVKGPVMVTVKAVAPGA
ncbi:Cytochrome p450 [Globisporangium polare]